MMSHCFVANSGCATACNCKCVVCTNGGQRYHDCPQCGAFVMETVELMVNICCHSCSVKCAEEILVMEQMSRLVQDLVDFWSVPRHASDVPDDLKEKRFV